MGRAVSHLFNYLISMHKCTNNTIGNVYHLEQWVDNFFPYSQEKLGFDQPVSIIFQSDEENAGKMLGKTAYYDPENMQVVLYTDGRHPKDIMRSLSHELVHHAQNCRGDFTKDNETYEGYAQSDPHLRQMEREAYTKGNLIFRDFEDLIKTGKINIEIDFSDSGEPKMSLKEWKNNELNGLLLKKWGLLKEEKNEPADVAHADRVLAGEEAGEDAAEELEEAGCGDVAYRKEDDWGKSPAAFTGTEDEEEKAIDALKHGKALEEDSEGEETYHYGEDEGRDDRELHDLIKRHATKAHIDALKRDMDYDEDHEDRREHGDHFRENADRWAKIVGDTSPVATPDLDVSDDDRLSYEKDPVKFAMSGTPGGRSDDDPEARAWDGDYDNDDDKYGKDVAAADKRRRQAFAKQFKENKKISVREAKEITRRIIERIKENK